MTEKIENKVEEEIILTKGDKRIFNLGQIGVSGGLLLGVAQACGYQGIPEAINPEYAEFLGNTWYNIINTYTNMIAGASLPIMALFGKYIFNAISDETSKYNENQLNSPNVMVTSVPLEMPNKDLSDSYIEDFLGDGSSEEI